MSIRVVARDHLQPGMRDKLLPLIRELVEITLTEKGNISYTYTQDVNDPDYYAMIEVWETKEALDAHMKSEHFQRIIPQVGALMAEPSRIEIYTEV